MAVTTSRFDNEKEQALRKFATIDKSKKGSVDRGVLPILSAFNNHPDYYTTSSCAGRILVLATAPKRKKNETAWLYATHGAAKVSPVVRLLFPKGRVQSQGTRRGKRANASGVPHRSGLAGTSRIVWLKQESAILHVCCRNLACAERLLDIVRRAGFKRAGIIATTRRIMLEIIGTDAVAIPLGDGPGRLQAPASFVSYAVAVCNAGMRSNKAKLATLFRELGKEL